MFTFRFMLLFDTFCVSPRLKIPDGHRRLSNIARRCKLFGKRRDPRVTVILFHIYVQVQNNRNASTHIHT